MVYAPDLTRVEETAGWVFYELQYVRREAQAEAELAYEAWCRFPGRDGYAVYRAAQDRADAAQDELAAWKERAVVGVMGRRDPNEVESVTEESP